MRIAIPVPAIRFGVAVTHARARLPRLVNRKIAPQPAAPMMIPGTKNSSIRDPAKKIGEKQF
jgi:hypothetical protein